jgi:hypothetical protein
MRILAKSFGFFEFDSMLILVRLAFLEVEFERHAINIPLLYLKYHVAMSDAGTCDKEAGCHMGADWGKIV